jgi:hypothetical protein
VKVLVIGATVRNSEATVACLPGVLIEVKGKIVEFVKQKNTSEEILSSLQNIEDRQYQNVSDVTKAAGLVY